MAFIECKFKSKYTGGETDIIVVLPVANGKELFNGKEIYDFEGKFKTLYLFHGLEDDQSSWIRYTNVEHYAKTKNIALVIPRVETSFYTDMLYGHKYFTFVSEELPRFVRSIFPLSDKREDNFVAGMSMGGYGALKLALSKPNEFSAVASFSGSPDMIHELENQQIETNADILFHDFGKPEDARNSENDLLYILKNLKDSNKDIPKIYQFCGDRDFLYKNNQTFKKYAESLDVDIVYEECVGGHEWRLWDLWIKKFIDVIG